MKTLKLLFAAAAAVMMSFTALAGNTIWQIASGQMLKGDGVAAKAVVADSGATLRFVYDDMDYGTKGTDWFSVAEAEKMGLYDKAPWHGCAAAVTKVVFDESFADYRPTRCISWFSGFEQLAAIENIGNLNTSVATSFAYMFRRCSSLTSLDLSGFDTARVTDMSLMFFDCSSLQSLDLSGFDTAKVTDMSQMFYGCSSLTSLNLSGFGTERVTNMSLMFYDCSSLTLLDLSDFDTVRVTDMNGMFGGCSSLKTIAASDRFVTTALKRSFVDMFWDCTALVGGKGTAYDRTKINETYARIDGGPSAPGYFTKGPVFPEDSYGIRFVAGGGSGSMATLKMEVNEIRNLPKCAFKPPVNKTLFAGWACSNGRRYDDGVLVFNLAEPGETVTMTAVWE